jgi:hypothetical protein
VRKLLRVLRNVGLGLLVTSGALVVAFRGGYALLDRALAYAYRRAERRHDNGAVAD